MPEQVGGVFGVDPLVPLEDSLVDPLVPLEDSLVDPLVPLDDTFVDPLDPVGRSSDSVFPPHAGAPEPPISDDVATTARIRRRRSPEDE